MSTSTSTDFASLMGPVAIKLLGEPTRRSPCRHELRWGTRGSLSVNTRKGVWYDHEANESGGVVALVQCKLSTNEAGALAWLKENRFLSENAPENPPSTPPEISYIYDYTDEAGELLFQVLRYEPKDFRQRRPNPNGSGGWISNMRGVRRVPFRLPELIKAVADGRTVYIAEGEKAALAVVSLGLPATCSPGGASKWRSEYSEHFHGADVVILPDNDAAGQTHAEQVVASLRPVARAVRIVDLPDLPPKGDANDWIAAGGTAEKLEELTARAGTPAANVPAGEAGADGWTGDALLRSEQRKFLEVLTPSQIAQENARPYVIKGLIARGDHAIAMGHPGSGKSVLASHFAYAVAWGANVFGRRVRGGPVIYIAGEDGHGMKNRVRALLKRHGDTPDFHLVPVAVDLMTDGPDRQAIRDLVERVQPVLIVIDTLARCFPGLRENEADDMGRVVSIVRDLSAICGSAVLTVHHVPKDGGTTPRGHGSLNGDADITLLIEGAGTKTRTVRLGKNRNGPSDLSLAFGIGIEALGLDEDGDPVTAPVAVEADVTTTVVRPGKERLPSKRNAALLHEVRTMLAEHGELMGSRPGTPPMGTITRQMLRNRLIEQSWFSDDLLQPAPQGGVTLTREGYKPENAALNTLKRNGFIDFNRDSVWLTSPAAPNCSGNKIQPLLRAPLLLGGLGPQEHGAEEQGTYMPA